MKVFYQTYNMSKRWDLTDDEFETARQFGRESKEKHLREFYKDYSEDKLNEILDTRCVEDWIMESNREADDEDSDDYEFWEE